MKNRDFQLIILLLILAVSGLFIGRLTGIGQAPVSQAVIYVKDVEYQRVSLEDPQLVVIEQDGKHNKVQVTKDGFFMYEATCENQDCLLQGEVTLENLTRRPLGAWVICLPNQVSVELVRGDKE